MKQALTLVALLSIFGCKKEPEPPPEVTPTFVAAAQDEEEKPAPAAEPQAHPVDELGKVAEPTVKVSEALVLQYLEYRKKVVAQGRDVVKVVSEAQAAEKAKGTKLAGAVRAKLATEDFVTRMREVEEQARQDLKLSREEVVAIGQVVGEVLSARQLWKRSGGDEAIEKARAELEKLPEAERAAAQTRLDARAKSFADVRDAKSARGRFGDAAVDAVLKHEDALWNIQRESAQVMSAVY